MKKETSTPALALSEEGIFSHLFDTTSCIGMTVIDRNGCILKANHALELLLGYTTQELVGKEFSILVSEEKKSELIKQEMDLEPGSILQYYWHKDGHHIWLMEETISPYTSKGWCVKLIYEVNTRVSENETVVAKKEEWHGFIHRLSHDLKAPINNLEGLVCIVKDMLAAGENPDVIFTMMHESIEKFRATLKNYRDQLEASEPLSFL